MQAWSNILASSSACSLWEAVDLLLAMTEETETSERP